MEYPYFKGLEADRYSFYRVPKALVKADLFQKMSGDAKLLYAVLLDRMSLSIKNGWQDKHGNAYIICTMTEHEKCLTNGTYERARESGTEQNYDMIDGCVNNVPKKPRRIGGRWSVLDRLHIKQAERKQKEQPQQQQQERSRKN